MSDAEEENTESGEPAPAAVGDDGPPPTRRCAAVCGAVRRLAARSNVEPVIFLSTIASTIPMTIGPLFLYFARCVELYEFDVLPHAPGHHNSTDVAIYCDTLINHNQSAVDILQKDQALYKAVNPLFSSLPAVVVSALASTWSDKGGGRRRPLLFNLTGACVALCIAVLATTTIGVLPVYATVGLSMFVDGLCGSAMLFFACTYGTVMDQSRRETQHFSDEQSSVPVRIAVASLLVAVGASVSQALVYAIRSSLGHAGYAVSMMLATAVAAASLAYAACKVRETHAAGGEHEQQSADCDRASGGNEASATTTRRGGAVGAPWRCARNMCADMLSLVTRKRAGWTRLCLCLSLACVTAEILTSGAMGVLFLMTRRAPFNWDDGQFITFALMSGAAGALGNALWPALFSRLRLPHQDSFMIVVGMAGAAIMFCAMAFARDTPTILATSVSSAFIVSMMSLGLRSFIPKMVEQNETARLYSAFGTVIALAPVASAVVFNAIYASTLDTWAGAVFIAAAGIQSAVLLVQIVIHVLMARTSGERAAGDTQPIVDDDRLQAGADDTESITSGSTAQIT